MQKTITIKVAPELLNQQQEHLNLLANALAVAVNRITAVRLEKRALDSRRAKPIFILEYKVWIDESAQAFIRDTLKLSDVSQAEPVLIVGAGPAGLFAALRLIELGFKPIVLERGKPVKDRRRDVAKLSKYGELNSESNYCFGEGGAGTFSDGKLYTRSTKRGSVERILNIFVEHGASAEICIDNHPHIGTNKLPQIVSNLSSRIKEAGGEVIFNSRVMNIVNKGKNLVALKTVDGNLYQARATIFATGHSARDVYYMLAESKVLLEAKPFALGIRVEHRQSFIDKLQYGTETRHANLPAAAYALSTQVDGYGVFSFCMCPGGIICPATTAIDEVVVNGWSPSKRNSRFANSGIVVEIKADDLVDYAEHGIFAGLKFQEAIEKKAFQAGGGAMKAPAERLDCFVSGAISNDLPECSYNPGVQSVKLNEVLPALVHQRIRQGIINFNKLRPGYISTDAIAVAVESRTSSPIRIPRGKDSLMHPELGGLFPCGEGAGYAGGIMSAAMDGERVAGAVAKFLG